MKTTERYAQIDAGMAADYSGAVDLQTAGRGFSYLSRAKAMPGAQIDKGQQLCLRILATTDLHGELLSYDYYNNRPNTGRGLVQLTGLIAEARRDVAGALLLDNGDFMQGSAVVERAAYRKNGAHPAIAAFNALHYDAVGLGNHEFNYGIERLKLALKDAHFPVLSSNVYVPPQGEGLPPRHLVAPSCILKRKLIDGFGQAHEIKIGIFALTPPQILLWDRHHLEGRLSARPMVETAREMVPLLRAAGADVVICLAHTGVFTAIGSTESPAEAADIAEIDGLDALIAGHSHLEYPLPQGSENRAHAVLARRGLDPRIDRNLGLVAGKPCVQPGSHGTHLGVIDLWLTPGVQGWEVARSTAQLRSVDALPRQNRLRDMRREGAGLRQAVGGEHRATLAWLRRPLAETRMPLNTHFALLQDCQAMRVVAAALNDHARVALGESEASELPIICAVTPFRTGGWGGPYNITDIPAGRLSLRHIYDLYPYPNRMVVKEVRVSSLRARMEGATGVFHQLLPGVEDQPLLDPAVPGFSFKIMAGLDYTIDLGRPHLGGLSKAEQAEVLSGRAPGRIGALKYQGRILEDDERVVLVTDSFLSAGHQDRSGEKVLFEDRRLCADLIASWAIQNRSIARLPALGWRLRAPKATSVVMPFGPGAAQYLDEIASLRPQALGETPEGFQSYRLHL